MRRRDRGMKGNQHPVFVIFLFTMDYPFLIHFFPTDLCYLIDSTIFSFLIQHNWKQKLFIPLLWDLACMSSTQVVSLCSDQQRWIMWGHSYLGGLRTGARSRNKAQGPPSPLSRCAHVKNSIVITCFQILKCNVRTAVTLHHRTALCSTSFIKWQTIQILKK